MISEKKIFMEEALNAHDVLNELIENENYLKEKEVANSKILTFSTRVQSCPRCKFESKTSLQFNYCSNCNWDKLTDPYNENYKAELAA